MRLLMYILLSVFLSFLNEDSDKKELPKNLIGKWNATNVTIVVRTEPRFMKFEFTKGSGDITMNIRDDHTASGIIGNAVFNDVKVIRKRGNPKITGVAYIIECGQITEIFNDDPSPLKEVELWLGPTHDETMSANLRFTQKGAQFPMAHPKFTKTKERSDDN